MDESEDSLERSTRSEARLQKVLKDREEELAGAHEALAQLSSELNKTKTSLITCQVCLSTDPPPGISSCE